MGWEKKFKEVEEAITYYIVTGYSTFTDLGILHTNVRNHIQQGIHLLTPLQYKSISNQLLPYD